MFIFLQVDAITSSSGTTIKYTDTITGTNISGEVIGARFRSNPGNGFWWNLIADYYSGGAVFYAEYWSSTSDPMISTSRYNIRVYYY